MHHLSDDQISRLLQTCAGEGFDDRRDAAILWLFFRTDGALVEISELRWSRDASVSDIDLSNRRVRFVTAEGSRTVPIPEPVAVAIDAYLAVRSQLGHAASARLWLDEERDFGSGDLARMVRRRGEAAGVGDVVHPPHHPTTSEGP